MLSVRTSNYGCKATLASWVLCKLPKCIHSSMYAQLKAWTNSFITWRQQLGRWNTFCFWLTKVSCHDARWRKTKIFIIRCVFFFLSIGWESTTWPANNCLRIMVCSCVVPSKRVLLQIIFCSCVIGTTFSREKWQIASLSCQEVIKIWKQTWWSNNKTIIELGYRKISWFVSVSQINYLPQPSASANNWSARHWQITIFCSTSSNNC